MDPYGLNYFPSPLHMMVDPITNSPGHGGPDRPGYTGDKGSNTQQVHWEDMEFTDTK